MNKEQAIFYSIGLAALLHLCFIFFPLSSKPGVAFSRAPLRVHVKDDTPARVSRVQPQKQSQKPAAKKISSKPKKSSQKPAAKKSSQKSFVKEKKKSKKQKLESPEKKAVIENLEQSIQSLQEDLASFEQDAIADYQQIEEVKIQKVDFAEQIDQGHFFASYGALLGQSLQERLQLPEYGALELLLTIDRFGNVLGIEILKSESKKNQLFIQEMLAKMRFTALPEKEKQKTFHLHLNNQF